MIVSFERRSADANCTFFLSSICSRRGTFIVVEGLDRAGKSTQVELLAQRMEERLGKDAVRVRKFPGERACALLDCVK